MFYKHQFTYLRIIYILPILLTVFSVGAQNTEEKIEVWTKKDLLSLTDGTATGWVYKKMREDFTPATDESIRKGLAKRAKELGLVTPLNQPAFEKLDKVFANVQNQNREMGQYYEWGSSVNQKFSLGGRAIFKLATGSIPKPYETPDDPSFKDKFKTNLKNNLVSTVANGVFSKGMDYVDGSNQADLDKPMDEFLEDSAGRIESEGKNLKGMSKAQFKSKVITFWKEQAETENMSPKVKAFAEAQFRQKMDERTNENFEKIQKHTRQIQSLAKSQEQLQNSFKNHQKQYAKDKAKFAGAIIELAKADMELKATIDGVKERVATNTTRIEKLETKTNKNTNDIKELQGLVGQNTSDIDMLNDYVMGGLNLKEQKKAIESGKLGAYKWNGEQKEKRLNELDKLIKKESLVKTLGVAAQIAGGALELGNSLGLFDSKSGAAIAKGIGFGITAANVASNLLTVPPNFVGAAFALVKGIFPGKPQESPELKYLKHLDKRFDVVDQKLDHMMDAMGQGFEHLDGKLNFVSEQINAVHLDVINLTKFTYEHHQRTMESFENVYQEFDRINLKLDAINDGVLSLLQKNYYNCLDEILLKNIASINDFEEYKAIYNRSNCESCLDGLVELIIDPNQTSFKMFNYNKRENSVQVNGRSYTKAELDKEKIYKPSLSIIKSDYKSEEEYRELYEFLLSPILYRDQLGDLRGALSRNKDKISNQSNTILDNKQKGLLDLYNYLNAEAILDVANNLLIYLPFLEIYKSGETESYIPSTYKAYISMSQEEQHYRRDKIIAYLTTILRLVENSLAQQTLVSGQATVDIIYNNLFILPDIPSESEFNQYKAALEFNGVLQQNFLKKFLENNVAENPDALNNWFRFEENTVVANGAHRETLKDNQVGVLHTDNVELHYEGGREVLLKIYRTAKKEGESINISVSAISRLLTKDMVYNSFVPKLYTMRMHILELLNDYRFGQLLSNGTIEDTPAQEINSFIKLVGMLDYELFDLVGLEDLPVNESSNSNTESNSNPSENTTSAIPSDIAEIETNAAGVLFITDLRDEQKYSVSKVGNQYWMSENLNYTNAGSCFDSQAINCTKFGRLYTAEELLGLDAPSTDSNAKIQGICPQGWRLPNEEDLIALAKLKARDLLREEGLNLQLGGGYNTFKNGYHFQEEYNFLPSATIGTNNNLVFLFTTKYQRRKSVLHNSRKRPSKVMDLSKASVSCRCIKN